MKYFTFFIIFLLSFSIQAQAPQGFSLSAGGNYSGLQSDDLQNSAALGYKYGIVFTFGYHETYNYQIEFFQNKSTFDLPTIDADYQSSGSAKLDRNTSDVGFFFNYYVILPDEDKFYIGPQVGVNFSFGGGELKPQKNVAPGDEYYLPHILSSYDLTSLSKFNYGAGIGLTGGYNDFKFDLRYTLGLNNVLQDVQTNSYDENNRYTGPALDGKVQSLSLVVSYRLNKLFGYE
ncbi:hypothetical protein J2X31_002459 [Flavobacterium arsenatis]|uniref:Outer membrane protein beta-barrel domain-containing protein n=1 Tax=Flavobacterium arsenatis TaxID=1484332 RepID=A0ABU1TRE3_9FLAO|nr:hypothetical protein [Flavobacterium arsenatis]MDR6968436.1 hypothetical protein [Flavobacterium arsenatis]